MGTKRSKGVTIFGWLLIIINGFALLHAFNFQTSFELHKSFNKSIVVAIISYGLLSTVIGFITGIGILKLKEMMRRLAIAINSLDIIFGIPLYFLSANDIRQYAHSAALAQIANKPTVVNVDTLANVGFYAVVSWFIFCIILSLLLIFFLTRPKVKEQFK